MFTTIHKTHEALTIVEQAISEMNTMEVSRLLNITLNEIVKRDPEFAARVLHKYLQAKAQG